MRQRDFLLDNELNNLKSKIVGTMRAAIAKTGWKIPLNACSEVNRVKIVDYFEKCAFASGIRGVRGEGNKEGSYLEE